MMGSFLETLLGGLMTGMLYSLVALGFVLIYKASGVFNFAQGAMVLSAALAMARFSEWIPQWLGFDNKLLANLLAFAAAMLLMVGVAWLIERLVLGKLPYGLQKRVELARALAAEPKMLLLDEPMAGMNVEEKQDMCRFVLDVNDEFGTTVVLIEHDMGVVMDISDRVVVLDYGKKIGDGTPDEVRNNPDVIKAYLGTSE